MADDNGSPPDVCLPDKPTLVVTWDPEAQEASFSFDTRAFKTWEMVAAVLQMALKKAEFNVNYSNMQRARAAEAEQQQAAMLRQQILRGRNQGPQA